jgi:hypothetical protein
MTPWMQEIHRTLYGAGTGSATPVQRNHPECEGILDTMNKRIASLPRIGFALVVAIILAVLSVSIERIGPEPVEYGNMCGPQGNDPCYKPALKGGFPVPYLFDAPGVSVERKLSFGEDQLSAGALLVDIAVYFVAILLAARVAARLRRRVRMRR